MRGLVTATDRLDLIQKAFIEHEFEMVIVNQPDILDDKNNFNLTKLITGESFGEIKNKLRKMIELGEIDFCVSTTGYDNGAIWDAKIGELCNAHDIIFMGHNVSTAKLCINKAKTKEVLKQQNIPVPDGRVCNNELELRCIMRKYQDVPIVLKEIEGISGRGMFLINTNQNQDLSFVKYPILAEILIEGIEISVDVYSRGDIFFMYPPVYKGKTDKNKFEHPLKKVRSCPYILPKHLNEKLISIVKKITDIVRSVYWLNIDIVIKGDEFYILEINSRFSGTSRLCYYATDINPYSIVLSSMKENRIHNYIDIGRKISFELPIFKKIDYPITNSVHIYYSKSQIASLGRITFSLDLMDKDYKTNIESLIRKVSGMEYSTEFDKQYNNFVQSFQT